eukprot:TRINITY_DN6194_c0_g1_i3.p3 TRINITY_DN6194_c0_g1~~TRINITY_DN6194_c0_g1_i3.p3  ORF type:complete len:106 (+),score=8.80 TRINITY_DN6194_c0_g1_i3:301-618(+)
MYMYMGGNPGIQYSAASTQNTQQSNDMLAGLGMWNDHRPLSLRAGSANQIMASSDATPRGYRTMNVVQRSHSSTQGIAPSSFVTQQLYRMTSVVPHAVNSVYRFA